MMTGNLFDIRKYSINDGPGIRTTLFFTGCPLRCQWCHNPESQSTQPQVMLRPNRCQKCGACWETCVNGAITWSEAGPVTDRALCKQCGDCTQVCLADARQVVGWHMNLAEVMDVILQDLAFYEESGGGVTLSGGEPLLQWKFCQAVLQACREQGIHTTVDTCGQVPWSDLEQVLPLVDLFLYDLKLADPEKHRQYTGVSNERILTNLRELSRRGAPLLVRIPLIPGVNMDQDELQHMGEILASLPNRPGVELLPYHASAGAKYTGLGLENPMPAVQPPGKESMAELTAILRRMGLNVMG